MEQKKQDRKEKMLDLSYWCWWRRKLWFKNNPDSFWEIGIFKCHWMKEVYNFSSVNASSFWYYGKKTYQLPGNSRNRGRIRVGELYKNSWRSFSFVSFIKKFFTEEQIKAHDDFFARRYNMLLEKSSLEQSTSQAVDSAVVMHDEAKTWLWNFSHCNSWNFKIC